MAGKPPVSFPHRDENTSAAPGISPGPVKDGELLLREMYIPYHVTEEGELDERAIGLKELRQTGVSVHRRQHTSAVKVSEAIERRLVRKQRSKTPWESAGVSVLGAGQIRQLQTQNGEKAFVVTDDGAEPDNKSHASIYAACPGLSGSKLRELRHMLLPILQKTLMPIEKAFEIQSPTSG